MSDTLFRYGHFLAILVMFATLYAQHLVLRGTVARDCSPTAVRLAITYGLSALLALFFGVSLWWWVGKPPGFYQANWVFQSKILVFGVLLAVSVVSSQFIWRHCRAPIGTIVIPGYVLAALRAQLLLMCLLPLLAVLMANGVGYTR